MSFNYLDFMTKIKAKFQKALIFDLVFDYNLFLITLFLMRILS
jgi:hypothetical protein